MKFEVVQLPGGGREEGRGVLCISNELQTNGQLHSKDALLRAVKAEALC